MRAVIEHVVERLAGDDLAARRPDQVGELRHEAMPVAVGRDYDPLGVERIDVRDLVVLAELGSGHGRGGREAPDEAGRLDRTIARM